MQEKSTPRLTEMSTKDKGRPELVIPIVMMKRRERMSGQDRSRERFMGRLPFVQAKAL
jgi:hypothetical protein